MLPKDSTVWPEILEFQVEAVGCLDLSERILPKKSIVVKCHYSVGMSDDRQGPGEQEMKNILKNVKSMFS